MPPPPLCIAFVIRDPLPPLRADVLTLFGEQLPRHGIGSTVVGQAGAAAVPICGPVEVAVDQVAGTDATSLCRPAGDPIDHPAGAAVPLAGWPAGAIHPVGRHASALASLLTPICDTLGLWRAWRHGPRIDAIQVRDKIASALPARLAAALLGVPFLYWMSFPIVEGYEVRRDELGRRARGPAWLGHALRARLSRAVLYRLVLPAARHVFVQSDAMAAWLAGQGVDRARMSAVPMGVDTALFDRARVVPSQDARLDGRRVIIYLGRIAQSRNSAFLLDVVDRLIPDLPELLLVIAGDAPSPDEMAWMRRQIGARKLERHVLLTGWLPQAEALGYAVRAEVGLSPIPRGVLFDVSSPTKLVEYLALGIPSVANDIPDQQLVISQSQAGLIAPMEAAPFSVAVRALLADPVLRAQCAARGPPWVKAHRSYAMLASEVADTYRRILPQPQAVVQRS
ncbi:MAG: glycosyltransferase [Massilia sp.]